MAVLIQEKALSEETVPVSIRTDPNRHLTALGPKIEMSPGLFGMRLPLPFALDHVNVWLLRDDDGWTLIDTGIANDDTKAFWSHFISGSLDGRPIKRLIATHFHPDHMGLAGWLCEQTGAEFLATRTEWLTARALAHDQSDAFVEAGRRFDHRAGLDSELVAARAKRGNLYRTRALAPPSTYARVEEGDVIPIDGESWRVLIGRGHAPEMIGLYNPEREILIAADQILQKISPNISVWPTEPNGDPLADYMQSLRPFRDLPETTLVLPSHGQPFYGLQARIDQLIDHHRDRLDRAVSASGDGRTAAEIMPALFDRELDAHQLGFALGEAIAHLNHLVANGRLVRTTDTEGIDRYSAS
jgi:glyoxylase-like metal-dependent hydrolase (beta-lactamase superfamily II)